MRATEQCSSTTGQNLLAMNTCQHELNGVLPQPRSTLLDGMALIWHHDGTIVELDRSTPPQRLHSYSAAHTQH
jgi:hypothetical protein